MSALAPFWLAMPAEVSAGVTWFLGSLLKKHPHCSLRPMLHTKAHSGFYNICVSLKEARREQEREVS